MNEARGRPAREDAYAGPAIVGSSGDKVAVAAIAYSARRHGQDTEECTKEAVDAGKIELVRRGSRRHYDVYRLTARGRELYRMHMERTRADADACLGSERRFAADPAAEG